MDASFPGACGDEAFHSLAVIICISKNKIKKYEPADDFKHIKCHSLLSSDS